MSFYQERYQSHQIHEKISLLRDRIESLLAESVHPENSEHLQRLLEIIIHIQSMLQNADGVLVAQNTLNKFEQIIDNINQDLDNFNKTGQGNFLEQANNRGENLLIHSTQMKPPVFPEYLEDMSLIKEEYRKNVDNLLRHIDIEKSKVLSQLSDIRGQVNDAGQRASNYESELIKQKTRIDEVISQFQNQFSETEANRRQSFENELSKQRTRYDNYLEKLDDETEAFIDKEKNDIINSLNEVLDSANLSLKKVIDDGREIISELGVQSSSIITDMKNKQDQAKEILGIIGRDSFSGNFGNIANINRKSANRLRILAILLMLLAIGTVGTIVYSLAQNVFEWESIFARIGVSVVLFVPAFYVARESSRHRNAELRSRKMELELASIDPFLERLPDEKKAELKATLTERLFAQPEARSSKTDVISVDKMIKMLKELGVIDNVGKVVDKLSKG